ncbi:M4 family metallopeptidase [Agreia sp. COWG]|uniref:M4 family metallopeptidase n=1 Tax=Agreia sp. COWG TaxID=2773266 RepID=UPI001928DAE4|nr:M4 family metallopeptidase [Agreia sp. COWG]CAD6000875.1 Extracellular metalloprotease [Agreia sp. COWG]
MRCSIVPPYLLSRLSGLDDDRLAAVSRAAHHTLLQSRPLVENRQRPAQRGSLPITVTTDPNRSIYDADGRERLPGTLVRKEGAAPTGDPAADEAYEGLGATHALFLDVYGRASIDARGLALDASVHYGRLYDNAFWDGSQMVFGDGDGEVFNRFTISLSVIGHELTHGVTQYSSGLDYEGQAGALNESVSDVFGALVEQHAAGQTATQASWLIGSELFTDMVEGSALRSMRAPGTAYSDDILGVDPQPAHMRDFVVTKDDNGGVHINSGIPNRAFYLVADALGGFAWQGAGHIWYDTITGGRLSKSATFVEFAEATIAAAVARSASGSREHVAVRQAWQAVGVLS